MTEFTLAIGNKNYSSWSLRGWLMAVQSGIAFEELMIPLDETDTAAAIAKVSPSGKVPVLLHKGLAIWESLAIGEYLAELRPDQGLWPAAPAARAVARAASLEMHSGFADLRREMPMNIRASLPGRGSTPAVRADIQRVVAIWRDCRRRFAGSAPRDDGFLFGAFTLADAMFAPVATRLRTYAVPLDADAQAYCDAIFAHPPMKRWVEEARREPWLIEKVERR